MASETNQNARYEVAVIQMVSTANLKQNLESAKGLVEQAARKGASLVLLPENFALIESADLLCAGQDEAQTDFLRNTLSQWAKEFGIWLIGGTLPCSKRPDGERIEKVRAVCYVFDPMGEVRGRYDKIHLFDVDVGDVQGQYRESEKIEPGDSLVTVDTPFGKIGLSVCYDLRFAEFFSAYKKLGVDLIVVPAAFTYRTGQAHWELLLRARAIENQFIVLAANQGGRHSAKRETWGHSMIIDPWGTVLACQEQGEGVSVATIDLDGIRELKARMPQDAHRRWHLFESN
ncbi:MAG: carbon-nitrogen hydrolase family protein [Pseudomonadales bacterium]|nr:carbon-nitrogen hydrolase family protein [Pseudomonadales bacterium]